MWDNNVGLNQLRCDWYILSCSYKWLGDPHVMHVALPDFAHTYYKDPEKDKLILISIHQALDEADIVIAHNGDKFDLKKLNARFLLNGMAPPSPYKTIDTLKVCRRHFALTSNKLDYVANVLGAGGKLKGRKFVGHDLWTECIKGNLAAWAEMKAYNNQDVEILEEVYMKLRPWMANHPNVNLETKEEKPACPKCGSADIHWRGFYKTASLLYHRFRCLTCGGWGKGKASALTKEKRASLTNNAG